MSFRDDAKPPRPRQVAETLSSAFAAIAESAREDPGHGRVRVFRGDSRQVDTVLESARVGAVITSPPYPNRMSYVRELRPYMYWLGYLRERSDAGNLDWDAIGGTWGAATSRLSTWTPDPRVSVPHGRFRNLVARIARQSPVLSRYVERYFEDMSTHIHAVSRLMAPGAHAHYVVGNAKFYDVVLPVEELYAALFESAGLTGAKIDLLRKRTSKQELFEFLVTAQKPSRAEKYAKASPRRPGGSLSRARHHRKTL